MRALPSQEDKQRYAALVRIMHRQVKGIAKQLNRSRLGSPAAGSVLDNLSKLIQVLAIVIGGVWILNDYWEFKKQNNELTIQQQQLAIRTAELTQSSDQIDNKLNELKLSRTVEGRLAVTSSSSVMRSSRFEDNTSLYRFNVSLQGKNVSDSNINIPAMVIEFFVGAIPSGKLTSGKAYLINEPNSFQDSQTTGTVKWTKVADAVHRVANIDGELQKIIKDFPVVNGGLIGTIAPSEESDWASNFVFRARHGDIAAAVITFWTKDEKRNIRSFVETRLELLSEAIDTADNRDPSSTRQNATSGSQDNDRKSSGTVIK